MPGEGNDGAMAGQHLDEGSSTTEAIPALLEKTPETSPLETVRFTIVMPLVPGYKGSIAQHCMDPSRSITGFIRWQSMDTIFSIRLDCLCQGRKEALADIAEQLKLLAVKLCASRTGIEGVNFPVMEIVPMPVDNATKYSSFHMGCTPAKVIELWRKERYRLAQERANFSNNTLSQKSRDWIHELELLDNEHVVDPPPLTLCTFPQRREFALMLWMREDDYRQARGNQKSPETHSAVGTSFSEARTSLSLSYVNTPATIPWWKPDKSSNACHICRSSFGITLWKHHCRKCGEIVCDNCSPFTGEGRLLKGMPDTVAESIRRQELQRLCMKCYNSVNTPI